jgi:hypothetical protein
MNPNGSLTISRALSELAAEGGIASHVEPLPPTGSITFYRANRHRYWRRQAAEIIDLVRQFSAQAFTEGIGAQGELLFEAALAGAEFKPTARKVRSYPGALDDGGGVFRCEELWREGAPHGW